jgi:DNA invertase Pin-like site-specific DNA recombinase
MNRRARARSAAAPAPRRIVGYVRVSTQQQADEGHSLRAQRDRLAAYCDLYGLELVAVLADEGASASTMDGRPGLAEALRMVRAGDADGVLVAKLDRLTRSTRDLASLLEDAGRRGWALLSVAEQLDTSSAAGRLVVGVLGVVGQWEREAIGERTSTAMASMRQRGLYTGGAARYGYRAGSDGTLAEDAAEQAVIAAVCELRSAGLSLRRVAVELERRGMLTRGGRRFDAPAIQRIETDAREVA